MYSHLRFVTAASLIAFGTIIGAGALALLSPALERTPVAGAEVPDPPAISCKPQAWLHFDRNCLSRRDLPWVAERGTSRAVAVEAPAAVEAPSAAEPAPEQPPAAVAERGTARSIAVEVPSTAETTAEQTLAARVPTAAAEPAPEQPPVARPPTATMERRHAAATPHEAASEIMAPRRRLPLPPPTAKERHVAKATDESQPRPPAAKKAAREDRAAKRRTNEALRTVRRFEDPVHDSPVSAYAADGTRRTIVIRPTSVQDVYYYSAPR